jgi:hypothetical protein
MFPVKPLDVGRSVLHLGLANDWALSSEVVVSRPVVRHRRVRGPVVAASRRLLVRRSVVVDRSLVLSGHLVAGHLVLGRHVVGGHLALRSLVRGPVNGVEGGLAHVGALANGRVGAVVAVGARALAHGRVLNVAVLESQTRVTPEESRRTEDHEDALGDDKGDLVGDGITTVPFLELVDTESATSEDDHDGEAQAGDEGNQAPLNLGQTTGAKEADVKVGKGDDESDQDNELEGQTSLRWAGSCGGPCQWSGRSCRRCRSQSPCPWQGTERCCP